jgi:hypothetical protein
MSAWILKMVPYLNDLWKALRARDYVMAFKLVLTMIVYAAIASGLVVLAGCGKVAYDSSGASGPTTYRSEVTRTDIVKPNDFEVAPSK